jgi:hypothetical protein
MQNLKEIKELTMMLPPQALVRHGARNVFGCQKILCGVTLLSSPATAPEDCLDDVGTPSAECCVSEVFYPQG